MAKDFSDGIFGEMDAVEPEMQAASQVFSASNVTVTNPESEGSIYDDAMRDGATVADMRINGKIRQARMAREKNIAQATADADMYEWLKDDANKALISYDDYENMRILKNATRKLTQFSGEQISTWGKTVGLTESVGTGIINGVGGLYAAAYGIVQAGADFTGLDTLSEFAQHGGDIGRNAFTTFRANLHGGGTPESFDKAIEHYQNMSKAYPSFDVGVPFTDIKATITTEDIASGGTSLVPTLVVGVLTGGMSTAAQMSYLAATAGLQSFGTTFGQKRAEGDTPLEAGKKASIAGAITAALTRFMPQGTEKGLVDISRSLRGIKNPSRVLRTELAKNVGIGILSEFTEEGLDEFAQAIFVDGVSIDEALDRGFKGGVIGGILGGGVTMASQITNLRLAQNDRAQNFRDELQLVADELDKTKTKERSQELVAKFMQSAGNLQKDVYIEPDALADIAASPESQTQLDKIGLTKDVIKKAEAEGMPVTIDLARLQANTNGDTRNELFNHVRETPDSPSEAEASATDKGAIMRQAKKIESEAKLVQKDFNTELTRLTKEISHAQKIPEAEAAHIALQIGQGAIQMFQRNDGDVKLPPSDMMKRISFQRGKVADELTKDDDLFKQQPKKSLGRRIIDTVTGKKDGPEIAPPETEPSVPIEQVDVPQVLDEPELGSTFESRQEYYQSAFRGAPHQFGKFTLEGAPTDFATADLESLINDPAYVQAGIDSQAGEPTINNNSDERFELRQNIADELYGDGAKTKNNEAWIILGPPASGKSSLADPIADENGALIVDSDIVKEKLPEFDGGSGANLVHDESKAINRDIQKRAVEAGDNIILPLVGSKADKIEKEVANLKKNGYTVHVRLVDLPVEKTLRRSISRFHNTGRYIPPDYITQEIGSKPLETYLLLEEKGVADDYKAFNNDVQRGESPEPITSAQVSDRILQETARERRRDRDGVDSGVEGTSAGQVDQTNTPAFKAWFGDSKVVDENGEPLVVFHGSPDVRGILKDGFEQSQLRGDTFFFSSKESVADTYADDRRAFDFQNAEPQTIPVYLSLNNPKVIDAKGAKWRNTEAAVEDARKNGHDGIIINNTRDEYNNVNTGGELSTVYVTFDNKDIKSAGTKAIVSRIDGEVLSEGINQGTFDPANPNIFKQDETGPRGQMQIVDNNYIVTLFDGADLSTVLHETGHIFMEEIRTLIASNSADETMMADWSTLSKWQAENKDQHIKYLMGLLGKTEGTEMQAAINGALDFFENADEGEQVDVAGQFGHSLNPDIASVVARSYHELFARGYESYLRDGVPPSAKMETAFGRFRTWLSNIYDNALKLNVKMTEEVRDVFNRMLATEKEIASYNLITGEEIVNDINVDDPVGKTKLNKKIEEMKTKAADRLFSKRLRNANKLRKDLRPKIAQGVMAKPIYRAWEDIKQSGGLRHVQILTEYGADTVKELRAKGLIAKKDETGALYYDVAQRNGFQDSEDMIFQLLDTRPPSREIKHRLDMAVIASEMDSPYMSEVVESNEFASITRKIAQYLSDAFRGTNKVVSTLRLRREAAKIMSTTRVGEAAKTHVYNGIVQKAIREERQAVAKDNYPDAIQANFKARMNAELSKESRSVKELRDKLLQFARKQKNIDKKSIEYVHWYQMMKLAERFELLPVNDNIIPPAEIQTSTYGRTLEGLVKNNSDGVTSIADAFTPWIYQDTSTRYEELQKEVLVKGATSYSTPKIYQMMETHEFKELDLLMRHLSYRGKDLKKDTIMNGKYKVQEIVDESTLLASTRKTKRVYDRSTGMYKFGQFIERWFTAPLKTIGPMMREQDGYNGTIGLEHDHNLPMAKTIEIPSAQAGDARQLRMREIGGILRPHIEVLKGFTKRNGGNKKEVDTGVQVTPKMKQSGWHKWTPDRIITVALNLGNEYGAESTAIGLGYTKEITNAEGDVEVVGDVDKLTQIVSVMTKEELKAVQGMWDGIDTLWADSNRVHVELFGVPSGKVEPDPISIEAVNGDIELKGGYWPLNYDSQSVNEDGSSTNQADLDRVTSIKEMMQGAFIPPSASRNHLKARSGSGGKMIMLDSTRVLNDHLDKTISFITHGVFIRDAQKIFNHPQWRASFEQTQGTYVYGELNKWLAGLLGRTNEDLHFGDTLINKIKAKSAVFILAFKLKGILSTMDAVPALMGEIGPLNYFKGMFKLSEASGIHKIGRMLEYSTFMRGRLEGGYDREAKDMIDKSFDIGVKSWVGKLQKAGPKYALATYAYPAIMYEWPAWAYMYDKTLQETGNHDTAVTKADLLIRNSQPSSDVRDQSRIMRSKKGVHVFSTLFSTWAHTRLQQNFSANRAYRNKQITGVQYLNHLLFTNVFTAMVFAVSGTAGKMLLQELSDGGEEEKLDVSGFFKNVGRSIVTDPSRGIPFADVVTESIFDSVANESNLFKNIMSKAQRKSDPILMPLRLAGEAWESMTLAMGSDNPDDVNEAIWDLSHIVSYSTGVPASKLAQQFFETYDSVFGGK